MVGTEALAIGGILGGPLGGSAAYLGTLAVGCIAGLGFAYYEADAALEVPTYY